MLAEIDLASIEYVCLNLRPVDRDEIFNVRPHDNPVYLAWEAFGLLANMGRGRVAWVDGKPAGVIGIIEHRRGVWDIMMFGTEAMPKVALEMMRWARLNIPELIDLDGRRLQCDSRVGHDEAHRFLMALGAEREGPPMRSFGKDGSDYQRFVWIKGDNGFVINGKATANVLQLEVVGSGAKPGDADIQPGADTERVGRLDGAQGRDTERLKRTRTRRRRYAAGV